MTIPRIGMAHGGGSRETTLLIKELIVKHLSNPILEAFDDSAVLEMDSSHLAFTTDSYVVHPLFFPGGDIGRLAACGTINDLVMQGARPKYLSLGLILEEGFPIADLEKIIQSLADVARDCDVKIVTGDTKVVERGKIPGMFINTSGIGERFAHLSLAPTQAQAGDAVLCTGTLGEHGLAVLSQREGLHFESDLSSDVAPLWSLFRPVFEAGLPIHVLRDPTRGGVAAALCDFAQTSHVGIRLQESALPIRPNVQALCRLLGMDPLHIANEGKAVLVCPVHAAEPILGLLKQHPLGQNAAVIGHIVPEPRNIVLLHTKAGGERQVDWPSGELLPRIC